MAQVVVVGSFVQDLSFSTARFPAPGETRIGRFSSGPGGKGFNQAVACARLEVDTLFVGAIGDDLFGHQAREVAEAEGLRARWQNRAETHTGVASIVVNEQAENTIVVALGANAQLSADELSRHASDFAGASAALCQLEANLAATRRALSLAREAGAVTILNPAPINEAVDRELIGLADLLVLNETEFAFLHERMLSRRLDGRFWRRDDAEVAALCDALGAPVVALTLGREGCFVAVNRERADSRFSLGERAWSRIPALKAAAVDTTGAGDAFCGGLASGLCRFGGALLPSLRFATAVAGLSTERQGAARSMPRLEAALARLEDSST